MSKNPDFSHSMRELARARGIANLQARKAALKEYYFPRKCAPYEYACLFLNWLVAAGIAADLIGKFARAPRAVPAALAAIPLVLFIADFMSACFHKWLDSFARERNPFWGSAARAFRVHHEFPNNLEKVSYLHNVAAFGPFITLLNAIQCAALIFLRPSAVAEFSALLLVVLFSQGTEIHRQAHLRTPAGWISVLQNSGVLLSRRRHLKHHAPPIHSDYGIINGWSNALIGAVGLWPVLDKLIWRFLKIPPHNWIHWPASIPDEVIEEISNEPRLLPAQLIDYAEVFPERVAGKLHDLIRRSERIQMLEV